VIAPAPRIVRRAARLVLRLYPRAFRDAFGAEFLDLAERRWHRERRASGRPGAASLRTGRMLVCDAARAIPVAWRERRPRPGGSLPPPDRGPRLMHLLRDSLTDLHLGLRSHVRQPASTALVVLTLALGVGASTAAFSALDRVVLHPLPFPGGDRMAYVSMLMPQRGWQLAPAAEHVRRWREGARTLDGIEVYQRSSFTRSGEGAAEIVSADLVSAGLPAMLGVRPVLGRMLGPADAAPGAPAAVMLSERYWRAAFGGRPGAIGQRVQLSDRVHTVVGIWPDLARFDYQAVPDVIAVSASPHARGEFALVLARRAPGVPAEDVERELAALSAGIDGVPPGAVPQLGPPYGFLSDAYVQGIWLVFAGAFALLGVAVVNAGNLLLGRAANRTGEIGVRLALGGTTRRLLRLFLAESLILASAGAALGALLAVLIGRGYVLVAPERQLAAGTWLHGRAVVFAIAVTAVAVVVCAVIPAWRSRSARARPTARPGCVRGSWAHRRCWPCCSRPARRSWPGASRA
jgi:hypothetical protein